ncbi:MAG: fumarylacetoacetate hydrolase family protein [Lysobacterales bacterium]|jgi:2-keto-4-pentenoate hydratase/2-oxohepta-3-ene-1,7-dioic acid hydratase in catechol pathway
MNSIKLDGRTCHPSKIVCIGQNYVDHIKELGNEMPSEPVIFLKPNSAIAADIQSLDDEVLHYEGELAFVIIGGEFAGVGFGLDLTKRAVQARLRDKGMPWERSKAFDGAAVFSDFVHIDGGLENLRLELWINGQLVQHGGYDLMMNKPADMLAEIGAFMSLEDGDVILSGTPKGVGEVNAGDRFHGKVFDGDSLLAEKAWTVR